MQTFLELDFFASMMFVYQKDFCIEKKNIICMNLNIFFTLSLIVVVRRYRSSLSFVVVVHRCRSSLSFIVVVHRCRLLLSVFTILLFLLFLLISLISCKIFLIELQRISTCINIPRSCSFKTTSQYRRSEESSQSKLDGFKSR